MPTYQEFATQRELRTYQACRQMIEGAGAHVPVTPEDVTAAALSTMGDVCMCSCRDAGASVPQMMNTVRRWLPLSLAARQQAPALALVSYAEDWQSADYREEEDEDHPMPTPGQQEVHAALQRILTAAGQQGLTLDAAFRVALAIVADALATFGMHHVGLAQVDSIFLPTMARYVWERLSEAP